MLLRLAVAGGVAVLLMAPYLYEYAAAPSGHGLDPRRGRAVGGDVRPTTWPPVRGSITTGGAGPSPAKRRPTTFPGFVALLLVVVALGDRATTATMPRSGCAASSASAARRCRSRRCLPFYPLLHAADSAVPGGPGVGAPGPGGVADDRGDRRIRRGHAAAPLDERADPGRWSRCCSACSSTARRCARRSGWVHFDGMPEVYAVLARDHAGAVAELPFPIPPQWFLNTPYMVNSTAHFRPLLNGYSGFRPPSYDQSYAMVADVSGRCVADGAPRARRHPRRRPQEGASSVGTGRSDGTPSPRCIPLRVVGADDDIFIYWLEPH